MVSVTGHVLDATYTVEDGEPVIRLFCRGEEDVFVAEDREFPPYFYIVPSAEQDIAAVKDRVEALSVEDATIQDVTAVPRVVDGEEKDVLQVYGQVPADIPTLRDAVVEEIPGVETREFDIPFYRRYLLDKQLSPLQTMRFTGVQKETSDGVTRIVLDTVEPVENKGEAELDMLAFDIEVHNDEIIMASFHTEEFTQVITSAEFASDEDWLRVVADEEALLHAVKTVLEDRAVDVLVTYNGDGYDLPRLRSRGREHNIRFDIGIDGDTITFERGGRNSAGHVFGMLHVDVYRYVDKILGQYMDTESLTLGNVAEELLGREKKDLDWEDIRTAWKTQENIGALAAYAERDATLTYELGVMLYPQLQALCHATGMLPFQTSRSSYGRLVENFLMQHSVEQNRLIPNRPTDDEYGERRRRGDFAGGFVYEPEEGLYENLAMFDYSSLYPSIIVSHNIDPETVDCPCCDDSLPVDIDADHFCQEENGFIPGLLQTLLQERSQIKDEMKHVEEDTQQYRDLETTSFAYKTLLNSSYGYYAFAGARWYCRECAAATAALGREYITDSIDTAEDMGFSVVYGDTDSVLLQHEKIREKADAFLDTVNSELPQFMELELEGFFTRGLFTSKESGQGAKKRYALLGDDGKMKITGFEQVRRDWSQVAKDTQKMVIEHVLHGEVEDAVAAAKNVVEQLRNGDVPLRDVIIYTQLTKKPGKYKSTSPHVEAAKKAQRQGYDIGPGQTVRYVIAPGTGSISRRARVADEAETYDAEYYIENQVVPAAMRVLNVFGYTAEDLLEKGTQTGLDTFT